MINPLYIWFNIGENICYGSFNTTATTVFKGFPCEPYLEYKPNQIPFTSITEFICCNPILSGEHRAAKSIASLRNFVFESDSMSLEDQKTFIKYAMKFHGLPVSTAIFSGNKSIHFTISLENPVEEGVYLSSPRKPDHFKTAKVQIYNNIHKRIVSNLNNIVEEMSGLPKKSEFFIEVEKKHTHFDTSLQDPSRFTRFPDVFRRDKENFQKSIYVQKRFSKKEFMDFLKKCPAVPYVIEDTSCKFRDFSKPLSEHLKEKLDEKIDFFNTNSKNQDMYPEILKFLGLAAKVKGFNSVNELYSYYLETIYEPLKNAGYKSLDKIHPARNTCFQVALARQGRKENE